MDVVLEDLKSKIHDSLQATILEDDQLKLEASCKELLIYLGYRVIDKQATKTRLNSAKDLVALFYSFLNYYHPEWITNQNENKHDLGLASKFINSRIKTGINKKLALQQCSDIMEVVFKNEATFNFKLPITFSVFGQDAFGWVTDTALQIINNKKMMESTIKAHELAEEYSELYANECTYDELLTDEVK